MYKQSYGGEKECSSLWQQAKCCGGSDLSYESAEQSGSKTVLNDLV